MSAIRPTLRRIAYREAAALLAADCDDADLNCDSSLSEEDTLTVREFIRNQIVVMLERHGREP